MIDLEELHNIPIYELAIEKGEQSVCYRFDLIFLRKIDKIGETLYSS